MDLKILGCKGVNWIKMNQDWVQWRVLMNTEVDLRVK